MLFKIDRFTLTFYYVNSRSWIVESGEFEALVRNSLRNILLQETFIVK